MGYSILTSLLVTVGGITADGQVFSPVTTLSSSFADDPADGILGLAWPSLADLSSGVSFVQLRVQRC